MKSKNQWHKTMYDLNFAKETIGSKAFNDLAKSEVAFLLKKLKLNKNAKILDVPCGTGRHAALFAKYGFDVTGIDLSNDCIKLAKKYCKNKVELKVNSMDKLEIYNGRFDAVLNLFSSFGYFSTDKENENVLRQMVKCLKPGGKLVINTTNRDRLLMIYSPITAIMHGTQIRLMHRNYNPKTKYNEEQTYFIDPKSKKVVGERYHRIRLYSKDELVKLMKKVGLKGIKVYGDFEGNAFSKKMSQRPIYIGHRKDN